MPRMYQVLHTHLPEKVSESIIKVQLDSESQKKDLTEKVQLGLMGFITEELNNYSIELQIEIPEEQESKNLIYKATDKFKYLSEQNPALETLKKKFNLDFE